MGDVDEDQCAVEADRNEARAQRRQLVGDDVGQSTVRVLAEDHRARAHAPVQEERDGQRGADQDAHVQVRREQQRGHEGGASRHAVVPVRLPGMDERANIDQPGHRQHDHRRQHRLRQVIQQRRQEQQRHEHQHAAEYRGHAGARAGTQVDRRARERPADRKGLRDAGGEVGQPLPDQLLVGVDARARLGGHRLGDRDRLHEGHQRDHHGRGQQARKGRHIQFGQRERGQARRDRTHHLAAAIEMELLRIDLHDAPVHAVIRAARRGAQLGAARRRTGQREQRFAQRLHAHAVLAHDIVVLQPHQLDAVLQRRLVHPAGRAVSGGGLRARHIELRREFDAAPFRGHVVLHQAARARVAQRIVRHLGRALEAELPAQQRGQSHRDQHVRQTRGKALERDHERQRRQAHRQRGQVGVADLPQHAGDVAHEVVAAAHRHAQQLVQLRQRDDDRRRVGEADDHRVRQQVDDRAQAQHAHAKLDQSYQEGQQDGQGDERL